MATSTWTGLCLSSLSPFLFAFLVCAALTHRPTSDEVTANTLPLKPGMNRNTTAASTAATATRQNNTAKTNNAIKTPTRAFMSALPATTSTIQCRSLVRWHSKAGTAKNNGKWHGDALHLREKRLHL